MTHNTKRFLGFLSITCNPLALFYFLFHYINPKRTYPGTIEERRQHERKSDDRETEEKH